MSFDDEIRRALRTPAEPGVATEVLASLRPVMKRARTRRHVVIGAVAVSLVGVGGVGAIAAVEAVRGPDTLQTSSPSEEPATAPATSAENADSTTEPGSTVVDDDSPDVTLESPSTTLPDGPRSPSLPPVVVAITTTSPVSLQPPVTTPTAPPATTVPKETPPPPVSVVPSTTVPSTTVPSSGERTISSKCGDVIVAYAGNSVTLVDTAPKTGFEVDVKNDGPSEVEVGFAGGDDECEVWANMRFGQLQVSVDNHDT